MIDQLSTIHERHTSGSSHDERAEKHKRWTIILIKTTLISNIVRQFESLIEGANLYCHILLDSGFREDLFCDYIQISFNCFVCY